MVAVAITVMLSTLADSGRLESRLPDRPFTHRSMRKFSVDGPSDGRIISILRIDPLEAVRSGAIIEKPAVLTERHKPRSTQAGPRDTPEDHVLEVTYDPVVDAEQWRRRELDAEGKRVLLKD